MQRKRIGMILLPTSLASVKLIKHFKSKAPVKISQQEPPLANAPGNTMMIGRGHEIVIQFSANGVRIKNTVPSAHVYSHAARP
jgi:hypothetical protein